MVRWLCVCDDYVAEVFDPFIHVDADSVEEAIEVAKEKFCYDVNECRCMCVDERTIHSRKDMHKLVLEVFAGG